MEKFATQASIHSNAAPTVGETNKTREANSLRFVENGSKDPVIQYWAAKAVKVLENSELSNNGRILIVRDIQKKIEARLHELSANPSKATKRFVAAAKPAELGCPKQIARLRESFKQFEAPKAAPSPIKKIHLPPRKSKGVSS